MSGEVGKFLACGILMSSLLPNAAAACSFPIQGLAGGQIYYLDAKKKPQPLTAASTLVRNKRAKIDLYYVINTGFADRSGVVVIKSARFGNPLDDDRPLQNRVTVTRNFKGGTCDPDKREYFGEISSKAYSAYHDAGKDRGDELSEIELQSSALAKLKQFHYRYEISGPAKCHDTDAMRRPDGTYESRSNRSQFAFDTDIVDRGYGFFLVAGLGEVVARGASFLVTPAFALPPKLMERKVELKAYQTRNGLACVPVSIQVRGPEQILRVVDLEGRTSDGSRPNELRFGRTDGWQP